MERDGAGRELGDGGSAGDLRDRLVTILGKDGEDRPARSVQGINERLADLLGRERDAREQPDIGEERGREPNRNIGLERDDGFEL